MTSVPRVASDSFSEILDLEKCLDRLYRNACVEAIAADDAFEQEQYLTATQHYWNSEHLREKARIVQAELDALLAESFSPVEQRAVASGRACAPGASTDEWASSGSGPKLYDSKSLLNHNIAQRPFTVRPGSILSADSISQSVRGADEQSFFETTFQISVTLLVLLIPVLLR